MEQEQVWCNWKNGVNDVGGGGFDVINWTGCTRCSMSNERRCSKVFMWDVSVGVGCMRLLKQVLGGGVGGGGEGYERVVP